MNVTFRCPRCGETSRDQIAPGATAVACPHCRQEIRPSDDAWHEGRLRRCLICPSTDLFIRKDFPQRLGVLLVVIGFVFSSVAWAYEHLWWTFAILFATALVDLVLYLVVGNSLTCYRCHAEYRDLDMSEHGAFELTTHEKYRQQAARLAEAQQSSGPAP
jgi:DNA-directed RNA polymerase subunit RPC12/RpoP